MKTMRKIERLVDYHQNAEEIVKDHCYQRSKIVMVLLIISSIFVFMAGIAYMGENIASSVSLVPAVLLLLALYVNTWTADAAPGSWFYESDPLHEAKVSLFKRVIKKSLFHLYPFKVKVFSADDKETLKMARDIIEE